MQRPKRSNVGHRLAVTVLALGALLGASPRAASASSARDVRYDASPDHVYLYRGRRPDAADPRAGHILDASGYLLPRGTVELGLYTSGYGVADWLNVGTFETIWLLGPLIGGFAGNLTAKVGAPLGRRVHLGLEGNLTLLRLNRDDTKIRGLLLPITLGASVEPARWQNYSVAARFIDVSGKDASDFSGQEIEEVEGAAITRLFQLIGHARFRATRVVAFYVRGYYQPWQQSLKLDATSRLDARTTVRVQGEAEAVDFVPWAALGGVHLRWGAANLRIGAGYGHFFIPRLGLSTPGRSVLPDLDFYARF